MDMDLLETYFRQRPSSGWVIAGLPNVEIRYYLLRGVLFGGLSEPRKPPSPEVNLKDYDDESHSSDDDELWINI